MPGIFVLLWCLPPLQSFLVKYFLRDIWTSQLHSVTFCENVTPGRALSVAGSKHTKHWAGSLFRGHYCPTSTLFHRHTHNYNWNTWLKQTHTIAKKTHASNTPFVQRPLYSEKHALTQTHTQLQLKHTIKETRHEWLKQRNTIETQTQAWNTPFVQRPLLSHPAHSSRHTSTIKPHPHVKITIIRVVVFVFARDVLYMRDAIVAVKYLLWSAFVAGLQYWSTLAFLGSLAQP